MDGNVFKNYNFKLYSSLNRRILESKKPQLKFTVVGSEPQFPGEYEPFNVRFKFENIGGTDSGEFTVRMLTECLDDSSLGVDQEDQIVHSLKPGETGEVILTFEHGMFAGNYGIKGYLDHYNQIHDKNKNMVFRSTSCDIVVG